jgi:hypothetical protein
MLAEDLLMLLHNPHNGRPLVSSSKLDLALGGALLCELTERRRVALSTPHRLTRNRTVVVTDSTLTGDHVLDEALQRIAAQRSKRAQVVVSKIAKGVSEQLGKRLAEQGILEREPAKLAVIPPKAWPAAGVRQAEPLRDGLRRAILGERLPTHDEASLIALLHAVGATAKALTVPGFEPSALKQGARAIAQDDEFAGVLRQAVKDAAF